MSLGRHHLFAFSLVLPIESFMSTLASILLSNSIRPKTKFLLETCFFSWPFSFRHIQLVGKCLKRFNSTSYLFWLSYNSQISFSLTLVVIQSPYLLRPESRIESTSHSLLFFLESQVEIYLCSSFLQC